MNITKRIASVFLALALTVGSMAVYAASATTPGYKLVNTYDETEGIIKSELYVTDGYGAVGQVGIYYDTELLDLGATINKELTTDFDPAEVTIPAVAVAVKGEKYTITTTNETNKPKDLIDEENGVFFFAWYSGAGANVDARDEDKKVATITFVVADGVDAADLEEAGTDLIAFATDKPSNTNIKGYSSGVYCANEVNTSFRNSENARNKIALSVEFEGLDIELETKTITIIDGDDKVDEVTDHSGFTYTFKNLGNTLTSRFLGYAEDADATEATIFAGETITVTADAVYYAVRQEIKAEDAEYTFEGSYDYSDSKYTIEMYYVGPKANMTAFGLMYPTDLTDVAVVYDTALQSTGTHLKTGEGYYVDVLYPTSGGTFGNNMKEPVLVATITATMTPEQYAAVTPETIAKFTNDVEIVGAYKNGEWQYIMHDESFSQDVSERAYPIYFTGLVDDKDVTVTVTGVEPTITAVTAPEAGKMLEGITFTAETAVDEEPGLVSYYVDGVAMGGLVPADDGITYTIPADKVLGDITIEFSYGEPILEVAITDITAPEVLTAPDYEATAGADSYTIDSVVWEPEVAVDGTFDFDTAYTVKVTVSAKDEYAFSGRTVYTINGETAVAKKLDVDTVEISYTFGKTAEELGQLNVVAGLVRAADKAAYANFGKMEVFNADGTVVATADEGTEAGNTFEGEFTLLAGEYTVVITKNGYLTHKEAVAVEYNITSEIACGLVAGNIYNTMGVADDNVINLDDFVRITSAFVSDTETTDDEALKAYRTIVDINEDGFVNVDDLLYVKDNFGKIAE